MSDNLSCAVFLSYASQDAEAAGKICDALRAAGIEVWFDQNELVGGDAWDAKIRKQIAECALFVPIISAATQARREGYFRLEWRLAAQRTHMMSEQVAFLLPAVIDATHDAEADVPGEFKGVQWTRLPGGEAPPAFCARVQALLGGGAPAERALHREAAESSRPKAATLAKPARRWPIPMVVGLMAIMGVVVWQPWKGGPLPDSGNRGVVKTATVSVEWPQPAKADTLSAEKSIAVLPIENRSASGEDSAFLADGIHEDLINTLSRVPGLKVMSRTAVERFRGAKTKMSEIAEALKVTHIVEAGVQRAGDQVRVNVQLVQAKDGQAVWSERYDRVLSAGGIFALQEEITAAIAQALQLRLKPEQVTNLIAGTTKNMEAYEAFLKGRQIWKTPGVSDREAVAQFQRAVELDPNFALAYGAMAEAYITLGNGGFELPSKIYPLAKAAAERALAIDPRCIQALTALGEYAFHYEWDWDKSERLLREAIRVDPNYASAYSRLSGHLSMLNRPAEAELMEKRRAELEPASPFGRLRAELSGQLEAQNFPAAVAIARQIATKIPDGALGPSMLGNTLRAAGQFPEAVQVLEKAVNENPDNILVTLELGLTYAAANRQAEAREVMTRLGVIRDTRYVSPIVFAQLATALQDRDLAFAEIERAFQLHDSRLPEIPGDDDLASLRGDPRFRAALKRLKLDAAFPETPKK